MDKKLTDSEIIKALECCKHNATDCKNCPLFCKGCVTTKSELALDLINRLQAENEDLFYKLTGVMHSVDKWLDGDELKQDEVNRAATMREKTLQIVEYAQKAISLHNADIKLAKAEAVKEFAERLNKEAEKVEIDREGDFVETTDKIYDTVADWCKQTSNNLLKELVGEDNGNAK